MKKLHTTDKEYWDIRRPDTLLQHFSKGETNNLPTWKAQVRKGPRGKGNATRKSRSYAKPSSKCPWYCSFIQKRKTKELQVALYCPLTPPVTKQSAHAITLHDTCFVESCFAFLNRGLTVLSNGLASIVIDMHERLPTSFTAETFSSCISWWHSPSPPYVISIT